MKCTGAVVKIKCKKKNGLQSAIKKKRKKNINFKDGFNFKKIDDGALQ